MGMPDVYSPLVRAARRARSRAAARRAHATIPWMIGYFIGNEPPWPARESQLVDLRARRARRARSSNASSPGSRKGDTPATRKELVHAAFTRYLEIVNAAVRARTIPTT